jgi:hypothetical protein
MRLVPAQRPVEPGVPVFADPRYVDAQLDIPISSQRRSYRASRAWMWFRSETPRARVLFCRHTGKIGARQARKWVVLRLTESEQVHLVVRRSAPDRMHADQIPRTRPVRRSPDLAKTRWA